MNSRNISFALLGAAAVFLPTSIVLLAASPIAARYEPSIYDAYPTAFWATFAATLIAGTTVLVIQSYARSIAKRYLIGCAFINGIWGLTLVSLPVARGYLFFGRHDPLTHIGMILDIQETGHIGPSNIYPVLHTLSYALALATGMDAISARAVVPGVLLIVFYASVFFLVLSITRSQASATRALALAFLPLYPSIITFTPSDTLFLYTPFILYLFYAGRTGKWLPWRVLFFLALLLAPFAHPELVIFLGLFFASVTLADIWTRRRERRRTREHGASASSSLLVLGAAFFLWFSSFSVFGNSVVRVRDSLVQETFQSPIQTYQVLFARSGLSLVDLAFLLAKTNGAQVLVIATAAYLFVRVIRNRQIDRNLVGFSLTAAFLIPLVILSLATNFILSYNRLLKYLTLMGSLVIVLALPTTLLRESTSRFLPSSPLQERPRCGGKRPPKASLAMFLSILCVTAVLSSISVYPSPIILQPNDQATATDFAGATWLIENGNQHVPTSDVIAIGRYVQALEGYDNSLQKSPGLAQALYQSSRTPPPHFDFTDTTAAGAGPGTREYLIVDGYTLSVYCTLFPTRGRFECTDFDRLGREPELNSVYSSGEFQVWFVDIPP